MIYRVFHGTRNASEILESGFRPSTGGEFGPGIYFTENPHTAAFYALRVARGSEEPRILVADVGLNHPFVVKKIVWLRMTEKRMLCIV